MKKVNLQYYMDILVESAFTDFYYVSCICENNNNLKIYLCIEKEKTLEYFKKAYKKTKDASKCIEYLMNNQPSINCTEDTYENVVKLIRADLEQYLRFNSFKLANAIEDQNGWMQTLLLKFYYFIDFYRVRWFHPEQLTKKTRVKRTYKTYTDFLNLARKSITEERKVQARKCAMNPEATIYKLSADAPMYQENNKVTLWDISAEETQVESEQNVKSIISRILSFSEEYENGKHTDNIKTIIETGNIRGKKIDLILLKIFAYKAGIITPKSLKFINNLSKNYKDKFGISVALLKKQMEDNGVE